MKRFFLHFGSKRHRGGFSLVEATASIGIFSVGFLAIEPMLALGMKTCRQARDEQVAGQIAQTVVQEAGQGTLASGPIYLDSEGGSSTASQAAFTAQSVLTSPYEGNAALTQITVRITPTGAPDRVRTYAVVYPTASTN